MISLLLIAMLQIAPDTLWVGVPVPIQETRGDTTIVNVNVYSDSLAVALERGAARGELALAEAIGACDCVDNGPPNWFYAGVLTVGAAFLYRYWTKDSPPDQPDNIDIDVDVRGPPHGRGKKHGHE